jgi:anti-anti-sigma regulatory factor
MVTTKSNCIIIESNKATLEDKYLFETQLSVLIASGATIVKIDLGNTGYLPSELMGFLMWKKKDLHNKGITLVISRISEMLKSFFDSAKISEYFELSEAEVVVRD